jgi:hypothetical protein
VHHQKPFEVPYWPAIHERAVSRNGCRTMDFSQRPMNGFMMVDESGMKTKKSDYWNGLAWMIIQKPHLQTREINKPTVLYDNTRTCCHLDK